MLVPNVHVYGQHGHLMGMGTLLRSSRECHTAKYVPSRSVHLQKARHHRLRGQLPLRAASVAEGRCWTHSTCQRDTPSGLHRYMSENGLKVRHWNTIVPHTTIVSICCEHM